MIPQANITAWSAHAPWPTVNQIEQDLLLARLIVEIANDPYLGEELVFRGGTCLHKLHLDSPLRYSEDLDYVRASSGGIAQLTRAVTAIGHRLAMEVRTNVARFPKIVLRAPTESGSETLRVKIEINTFELSPARAAVRIPFSVDSPWFTGGAAVTTFAPPELITTKLRALYQRSKGRDLFDLWIALNQLRLAPADIVACFDPYRPAGFTRRVAEANLRAKLADRQFRDDLRPLVSQWPSSYDIDTAGEQVIDELFTLL